MSLAERVTTALIASSTLIVSPGRKAEFRGLLRGRVLGDRNSRSQRHCAAVELFEQEVERHHLGDRSGMTQSVLGGRIERLARVGVDDDR